MSVIGPLIGVWVTDRSDVASIAEYGDVSLRFEPEGKLIYSICEGDHRQIAILTFRVEGDTLVINQPSKPREERVRFELAHDGKLTVFSQPVSSTYVRMK